MDYIREELLRQQRALAVLMTGGESVEHREMEKEAAFDRAVEANREEAADPSVLGGEAVVLHGLGKNISPARAEQAENGVDRGPGEELVEWAAAEEIRESFEERERRPGGDHGFLRTGDSRAGTAWQATGDRNMDGDAGVWTFESGTLWEAAFSERGGGFDNARALSRAFQRDARRYDGGFSLY